MVFKNKTKLFQYEIRKCVTISIEINLKENSNIKIIYSVHVHGWRHFLVWNTHVLHFVCFGEETWNCKHFLIILSLKTLWAGVKHWRTALHRFYVYRKPISSPRSRNLKVIQKCVHLKCICVWCLDNWSRILSGKPFNTFSMARLKTLQFRLTLTPLFTATHAFLISLLPFFFMICDWGSPSFLCRLGLWFGYFFNSRDPRFMSLIDSPWFVKFSKMAENPPFKVFVYGKGVQNTCRSKCTNIFFFNFQLYFRRHLPLMPPS